ncbi:MAG: PAS domain S-box protein [Halobacteriota archaeon]
MAVPLDGDDTDAHLTPEVVLREFAPHPYQSLNEDGEILAVNDAWVDALGYERSDAEGEWFGDLLRAESRERFSAGFVDFKSDSCVGPIELEVVHADGHTVFVPLDGKIEVDDSGAFVRTHCQFTDITAEKRRRDGLTRFCAVLDQSHGAIFVIDPEQFEFVDVNSTACRQLGYDRAELLELHPSDIETTMIDGTAWQDGLERLRETGSFTRLGECRRKDGTTFPVEVQVSLVELDDEYVVSIARDITERKAYEERLKEQRDNLELLNQVLRHDIRNDLQLVLGYAELLEDDVDGERREYVEKILGRARQAVELTMTAGEMANVMLSTQDNRRSTSLRRTLRDEVDEV